MTDSTKDILLKLSVNAKTKSCPENVDENELDKNNNPEYSYQPSPNMANVLEDCFSMDNPENTPMD